MKHLLLIAVSSFLLLSCNSNDQKEKDTATKESSENTDDCCKKIRVLNEATEHFRNRENTKWANTKKFLESMGENKWDSAFGMSGFSKKILTGQIEEAYASWYISNYRLQTQPDVEGGKNIDVTEAVWVDREAILDLANTLLSDPSPVDGVRIYFAKYPAERQIRLDPSLDPADFSRKALIFVPTKDSTVGTERYHRDYYTTANPGDGIYIYDYNSLCPKKCVGAVLGEHDK